MEFLRHWFKASLVTLTLSMGIGSVGAQPQAIATERTTLAGTWEGQMNDRPAITLKIHETDAKITGVAIFYFQKRTDPNGPWQTEAEYPSLLLVPQVEGKTLTFEIAHHKCHECQELGPNAKFSLELTGPNEARLRKTDGDSGSR